MVAQTIDFLRSVPIELAERRLRHFVRQAWPVIEPFSPFKPNWHLDAISDHLEAVEAGEIRNLLVTMPPRMGKSLTISVFYPAWRWINQPGTRFLYASYSQDLATLHSVATRRVIESDWYQKRWGDRFHLAGDANLKTRFENDQRGARFSTSVGGVVTGIGGDRIVCLRYNQEILTDAGLIPIGELVRHRLPVHVLSFDHSRNRPEWRPIDAYESANGRPMVAVLLSTGERLECTDDHPVFVRERGYVQAGLLRYGDEVMSGDVLVSHMRQGVQPSAGARREVEGRSLLLGGLFGSSTEWGSERAMAGRQGSPDLPRMRQCVFGQACAGKARCEILLSLVPEHRIQGESSSKKYCHGGVRSLWCRSETDARDGQSDELLFPPVRQRLPFSADGRGKQPQLATRIRDRRICEELSSYCSEDSRERWASLPALRDDSRRAWQGTVCPPYRLHQDERYSVESHKPVPVVSSPDSWPIASKAPVLGRATVLAVERIDTPDRVYNIRVDKNHNYFASGILVHNCDDPQNVKEAESEVVRASTITWWDQAMSTRFNNPKTGARIVVMQRVHEGDLAGHLIEQGGYVHLNLPMEYEPEAVVYTGFGKPDPRSEPGELLAPERIGPEEIADLKVRLGSRAYAGQFQQRPAPAEGAILKRDWWQFWDELPEMEWVVQSWDTAFKTGRENDYSACLTVGYSGGRFCVLDRWKDRVAFPELERAVRAQHMKWRPDEILVEDAASGQSLIQQLQHEYDPSGYVRAGVILPIVPVKPDRDKLARVHAISPYVEGGRVFLPATASWRDDLIDECGVFPAGLHDDQVDALTMAIMRLAEKEQAMREIDPALLLAFGNMPR